MAGPAPSSSFARLADVCRCLSLRNDVDDIVLELLGRFSLERIYHRGGGDNKETYQQLVITLLAQLNAVYYLQRLTLPSESFQVGRFLGFLVSWEVTARSVELVLQLVVEGRDSLWEARELRDKYLAEFLLSALRILTLHPRPPSNQRAKDRRDRFARIHSSLEQVFDGYPGPKSFLLMVCKEVTDHLHKDPNSLALPQSLRLDLPTWATELYPLPPCLLPLGISELLPNNFSQTDWLPQFLALRDVTHFLVGSSIQYTVNQETRDVRLQSLSAKSRNVILKSLDNLRLPRHLSKPDLVATFNTSFRMILPDTLDLSTGDPLEQGIDEYELDALDALSERLNHRQILHRVSDTKVMHAMTQVTRNIQLQDNSSSQHMTTRPSLYALNCPDCHLVGGSDLRACGIDLPLDPTEGVQIMLPQQSTCLYCDEAITMIREVSLARQTWDLLMPIETDADTINVERHLSTQFQLGPSRLPPYAPLNGSAYSGDPGSSSRLPSDAESYPVHDGRRFSEVPSFSSMDQSRSGSQQFATLMPLNLPVGRQVPSPTAPEGVHAESSNQPGKGNFSSYNFEKSPPLQDSTHLAESPPLPQDYASFRRPSQAPTEQSSLLSPTSTLPPPPPPRTPRSPPATREKAKPSSSRWKLPFTSTRKPSIGNSAESSSLSSTTAEDQKLEEISLKSFSDSGSKSSRNKSTKNVQVSLSQHSTLALFWSQHAIQLWDLGTSPSTMIRSVSTESTCILAAVGSQHLAYIIGTRDQKLTLRIMNLVQPSVPVVEYRIPSSLWCKSIAIDRQENLVVVGFENCVVRFFRTTNPDQPREDRLHSGHYHDCRSCPHVETLAFSSDGLSLLASTRSPKSGLVQIYLWRFPFLTFEELTTCRYTVPLHESEDNGISSVIFRSGQGEEENLICITTWTQSGSPILIQPHDGHRSEVKSDPSSRHGKLGSRIQCAAFSPSGRELAMVNDKGHLYMISNLDSSPIDVRRRATSKELTAKTLSFSLAFMTLSDEEYTVLAWADSSKGTAWVKKIPATSRHNAGSPETDNTLYVTSPRHERSVELPGSSVVTAELSGQGIGPPTSPVELATAGQILPFEKLKKFPRAHLGLPG